MQEEVENRTINLAISTAKLTTRSIIPDSVNTHSIVKR